MLFEGKAALIFNILFGVSFYIILRKPGYSIRKFVWRCLLLVIIGLVNRLFYDNDILVKYGVMGMCLVCVRNFSKEKLLLLSLSMFLLSIIVSTLNLGELLVPEIGSRYVEDISMHDFICHYPYGLLSMVKGWLNDGFFPIFAFFCFGYWLGRVGIIDSMDKHISSAHVLIAFVIFALLGIAKIVFVTHFHTLLPIKTLFSNAFNVSGALFYWCALIFVYNNSNLSRKFLSYFESYGKCGLTNYSMQGFFGVVSFTFCGIAFKGYSFSYILLSAVSFYLFQTIISNFWLKRFRNGPMEFVWRCATERKVLQLKK